MKDLLVLLVHLLTTIAKLLGPGGARTIVADSLLMRQQINEAFGIDSDKDVVRRVLATHYQPGSWWQWAIMATFRRGLFQLPIAA